MADAGFSSRFTNWYNWYRSGAGPFRVGGDDYIIPNFNYMYDPAYSSNGALTSLSEGQSYGLLYALMADRLYDFQQIFLKTLARHELTEANIAASKDKTQYGPWGQELIQYMDRLGNSLFDVGKTSLKLMGWVASNNYSGAPSNYAGLSSVNAATDGDVVFIAACLMAWERWGVKDYRDYALASLTDLAQWCVKPAASRHVLTMGPYRAVFGGFHQPYIRNFDAATDVNAGTDAITYNTEFLVAGDAIRFWTPSGSTMPAGLVAQDTVGTTWPKYYARPINATSMYAYTSAATAIAGGSTGRVNITAVGSGQVFVIPYVVQRGTIATDPSYLFPNLFRLFAKYDTANTAVWNSLATNAYTDIQYSISNVSTYSYPTYLIGVSAQNGNKSAVAGDNPDYLDQVRVYGNLAYDGTPEAKAVLASTCDLVSGKYVPKAGLAGSVWRYYLDSGLIPSKLGLPAANKTFTPAQVNVATNQIVLDASTDSFNWATGTAVTITSTVAAPSGLSTLETHYIRMWATNIVSFHSSAANALAGTGIRDITSQGSGAHTIVCTAPQVGWHYRSPSVPIEGFSPYNAGAILAQIYALNGAADAQAFYDTWPAWVKAQTNGSFVENNADYYVQHVVGMVHGIIGGNADYTKEARSYVVGLTQQDAMACIGRLNAVVSGYAVTPLTNGSQFAVKVLGNVAFAALTNAEKAAAVKTLPQGYVNIM